MGKNDKRQDTTTSTQDQNTAANPPTEAQATLNDPTHLVPAGSADATADHTADSPNNGTLNTDPQSPIHQGNLSDKDKQNIVEEANQEGAVVSSIAAKHDVTSERVLEVVDEANKERR